MKNFRLFVFAASFTVYGFAFRVQQDIKFDPKTQALDVSSREILNENQRYFVELEGEPLGLALKSYANPPALLRSLRATRSEVKKNIQKLVARGARLIYEYEIAWNGFSVELPSELVENVRNLPHVKNIVPVQVATIPEQDWKEQSSLAKATEPMLPPLGIPEIWKSGVEGQDITIAIFDTGVDYTHPDLGGCLGPNCKVIGGYDLINNDEDPKDDHSHGTHCAGIAAGDGLKKGAAPKAKIVAYKVLNRGGSGTFDTIIKAIDMALAPVAAGKPEEVPNIMSFSLGGPGIDAKDPVIRAVNAAALYSTVVVAAGNSGRQLMGVPASAENVVTVAATEGEEKLASFSSIGPGLQFASKPDIAAPGVNIPSTVLGGQYANYSGTSMATPLISGIAALFLSKNKSEPFKSAEVKSWVQHTAKPLSSVIQSAGSEFNSHFWQGAGLVQPLALVTRNEELILQPCLTGAECSSDFGMHSMATEQFQKKQIFGLTFLGSTAREFDVSIVENHLGNGANVIVSPSNFTVDSSHPKVTLSVEAEQKSGNLPLGDAYPYSSGLLLQITDKNTGESFQMPMSVFLRAKYAVTLRLPKPWYPFVWGRVFGFTRYSVDEIYAMQRPDGTYYGERFLIPGEYVEMFDGQIEPNENFFWRGDPVDIRTSFNREVVRDDFYRVPLKLIDHQGVSTTAWGPALHTQPTLPKKIIRAHYYFFNKSIWLQKMMPQKWQYDLSGLTTSKPSGLTVIEPYFLMAGKRLSTSSSLSEVTLGDQGYMHVKIQHPFGTNPNYKCWIERGGGIGWLLSGNETVVTNEDIYVGKGGIDNETYGLSVQIYKGPLLTEGPERCMYDDESSLFANLIFDKEGMFTWGDFKDVPFHSVGPTHFLGEGQPVLRQGAVLQGLNFRLFPQPRVFKDGSVKIRDTAYRLRSLTSGTLLDEGLLKVTAPQWNVAATLNRNEIYSAEVWFPKEQGGPEISHAEWIFSTHTPDETFSFLPSIKSFYWKAAGRNLELAIVPVGNAKGVEVSLREHGKQKWEGFPLTKAADLESTWRGFSRLKEKPKCYEMQLVIEDEKGSTMRMYHHHPFATTHCKDKEESIE